MVHVACAIPRPSEHTWTRKFVGHWQVVYVDAWSEVGIRLSLREGLTQLDVGSRDRPGVQSLPLAFLFNGTST
jgi:hypothetical protein